MKKNKNKLAIAVLTAGFVVGCSMEGDQAKMTEMESKQRALPMEPQSGIKNDATFDVPKADYTSPPSSSAVLSSSLPSSSPPMPSLTLSAGASSGVSAPSPKAKPRKSRKRREGSFMPPPPCALPCPAVSPPMGSTGGGAGAPYVSVSPVEGKLSPYGNPYYSEEDYGHLVENEFLAVKQNPYSTFSIDVDTAAYANVRRLIKESQMPPQDAVRTEELVNYFTYDYPQPKRSEPFSINTEVSDCPWAPEHRLVQIGLQGRKVPTGKLPASNLVFLIDVSGSMQDSNKLPLIKKSFNMLVERLRPQDRISIVTYAGSSGLVLPPTAGSQKRTILDALGQLESGGGTAGGEGIRLAYDVAMKNFVKGGNNRVILATDGDFNDGVSSETELESLIEEKRKSGVFLTVLGYGTGNYKDVHMETLADKGNGNHAYIDSEQEAKKVLINEFGGTLFAIAKDVKLQVEFNPQVVKGYRLLGYENRLLAAEDFNDDKKDAGELGSGHTVTALYEVIPTSSQESVRDNVDPPRYQKLIWVAGAPSSDELMSVKLRYKAPDSNESKLIEHVISTDKKSIASTSNNFRWAAAVAEFALVLKNSKFRSDSNYSQVLKLAEGALGGDKEGYRSEFLDLVRRAQQLDTRVCVPASGKPQDERG